MTALPPSLRAFLDVFSASLADVRFADIDAETLQSSAAEVEAAAERLAEIQASLEIARVELTEKTDAFVQLAQRAHAYARIYAEGNAELSAQLEAIALPKAGRRSKAEGETTKPTGGEAAPVERVRTRKRADTSAAESAPAGTQLGMLESDAGAGAGRNRKELSSRAQSSTSDPRDGDGTARDSNRPLDSGSAEASDGGSDTYDSSAELSDSSAEPSDSSAEPSDSSAEPSDSSPEINDGSAGSTARTFEPDSEFGLMDGGRADQDLAESSQQRAPHGGGKAPSPNVGRKSRRGNSTSEDRA